MRLLNPKHHVPGRVAAFQRDVMERVRALPGLEHAAMTSSVPFAGGTDFVMVLRPAGSTGPRRAANMRPVDPEYFPLMRIPLLAGRLFTGGDDESGPKVAIVSASYGRALFGDDNPVGRALELEKESVQVVGVVADARHARVIAPAGPAIYFPRAQHPNELVAVLVRPRAGSTGVAATVRAAVQSVDPEQPIEHVRTLDDLARESTAEERFYTVTTAGFAAVAVLLAIAGLAAAVSRTVTERVREMAIRLALGAEGRDIVRLAMRQGLMPVLVGLALGLIGAWAASRLLQRFLFEVSPLDPVTYAAALAAFGTSALLACYLPARRALGVQPMAVLKGE